ncbi:GNAT family N-acetyltransferase [Dietzia sp.]|uniref:GNAT family N-acetyltransferase n=1 Tax=Dietzia sp. TaxID=1871616 RepID=UPI002FD99447
MSERQPDSAKPASGPASAPSSEPAPSTDFPDCIDAAPFELRRLRPLEAGGDANEIAAVDEMVPEEEIGETFRFFTSIPAGGGRLSGFLAEDAPRCTYAVWNGDRPIGCTSLYNWDLSARTCMIGYTWMAQAARGTGANVKVKEGLFATLREHGFRMVRLRADIANERSRAAMAKVGAVPAEIEPGPRVYARDPDREARSQYFEREL